MGDWRVFLKVPVPFQLINPYEPNLTGSIWLDGTLKVFESPCGYKGAAMTLIIQALQARHFSLCHDIF
jgi:hypothetical protein